MKNKLFSFISDNNPIIEAHVKWSDLTKRYPDNVIVTLIGHPENGEIVGDVVAILTPQEYLSLEQPKGTSARFAVLLGENVDEDEMYGGFSPLYWQTRDWDLLRKLAAGGEDV